MNDRIVPGNPKALTNADLLAALSDLLAAGTGITVAWNGTNEQWTISSTVVGTTNLAIANRGTTTLDVTSDTGTDATIPAATTSLAGLLASADKSKLDGIASGATANSTDAQLRDRTTHTGTQAISTVTGLQTALDAKAAISHTHGNITNAGAIGSTANLPLITTTSGVITTGAFGSTANTFCQGNDSRLSDARTPTSHVHGNISNAGAIGSTANLPLITTTSGVITTGSFGTTANTFCQGNDSRLSDARTPTSHVHGNISNAGAIGSTSGLPIITGASGVLQAGSFGTTSGTFAQGNDSRIVNAAQTNASNTFTSAQVVQNNLNIYSATLGISNGYAIYATNGTSSGDFLYFNQLNTGAEWRFRRDGAFSSSFIVLGNGPRLDANAGLTAIRVRETGGGAFANLEVALVFVGTYTVGTLPAAASNAGAFAQVTDSNSTTNGNTVAGGGANRVPVFSNGTNWIIK